MQKLLTRAKAMYFSWLPIVVVSVAMVSHSAGWLSKEIFPRFNTESPLVVEATIVILAFLIYGHVVSDEKLSEIAPYLAGVLTGIGFLLALEGLGGLGLMYVVGGNQLRSLGESIEKGAHNQSLQRTTKRLSPFRRR